MTPEVVAAELPLYDMKMGTARQNSVNMTHGCSGIPMASEKEGG